MENQVYSKMFIWLFIGLLITFGMGYYLSFNINLLYSLVQLGILPIIIIELVLAVALSAFIKKMPEWLMKVLYLLYTILTGVTFGIIFMAYNIGSIISMFAISALIFALLAFYGITTQKDLSNFGTFLFFMLLGLIIGELLNYFIFKSSASMVLFSAIGVGIFTMYIAYDTNRVKLMLPYVGEEKAAIYGAFQLYLDFINLFIRLLELFGKRND
jgi:FtsH-binding integral membrane protein